MSNFETHEQNRLSWNAATRRHNLHKGDQASFFRDGGSTLYAEETELLGDIAGKSLVHLQCNCGQDTLSVANHLGATVTGVDISDEAIEFAQKLSADSGIPACFERGDVVTWCARQDTPQFDVVFVSYGAVTWLSDLEPWGRGIANVLKPGGRFVLMEFHPAIMMFDEGAEWVLKYDYLGGTLVEEEEGVGDYVAESGTSFTMGADGPAELPQFENPHHANAYSWGIAETVMPLIDAGLVLEHLVEYPYSNGWRAHERLAARPGKRFAMPDGMPNIAMMFSVVARKP